VTVPSELVNEQVRWNLARVVRSIDGQGHGDDLLVVEWPRINRNDIDGLVARLKGLGHVNNPMAGTQWARTGTYAVGPVTIEKDQQTLDLSIRVILFRGDFTLSEVRTDNNAAFTETTTYHYRKRVLTPLEEDTAGTIHQRGQVSRDAELGVMSWYDVQRVAINQTAAEWEKRHDQTSARSKNTQGAAVAEPSAPSAGTIVRVVQDPTEYGKNRTVQETITASNQTATEWEKRHDQTSARSKQTQGAAVAEPSAPAAGTIVRVVQDPTEFGKNRSTQETITASNQTATEWEKRHDQTVTRSKQTQGAAVAEPSAPSAGTIVRVAQDPTEFGKNRSTQETATATAWRVTKTWQTRGKTATIILAGNQDATTMDADIAGLTAANVNSVGFRYNEFGLYNYELSSVPAEAASGSGYATDYQDYELEVDVRVERGWRKAKVFVKYYDSDKIGLANPFVTKKAGGAAWHIIPGIDGHVTDINHLEHGKVLEAKRVEIEWPD
jgi:hypothetical protein